MTSKTAKEKRQKMLTKLNDENEYLKKKVTEIMELKRDIGRDYDELKYKDFRNRSTIQKLNKELSDIRLANEDDATKVKITALETTVKRLTDENTVLYKDLDECKCLIVIKNDQISE